MWVLRILFLLSMTAALIVPMSRGRWEGHLQRGNSRWRVDLDRGPVWNPPPLPDYSTFQETFPDLPWEQPPRSSITRVIVWYTLLMEILLAIWWISGVLAIVYLIVRQHRRDAILHLASCIALSLTFAIVLSLVMLIFFCGMAFDLALFIPLGGLIFGVCYGFPKYKHKEVVRYPIHTPLLRRRQWTTSTHIRAARPQAIY